MGIKKFSQRSCVLDFLIMIIKPSSKVDPRVGPGSQVEWVGQDYPGSYIFYFTNIKKFNGF